MNTLLIIDFNNTIIRSMMVNQELSYEGMNTGGVYGFVTQLAARINDYEPEAIIVCDDRPPYLRKRFYPDYKANRKQSENDFFEALNQNKAAAKDILKLLNIPLWGVQGLEADDLIARLVEHHKNDYDKIVIVSTDDDLYQLLNNNITLHKGPKKGEYTLEKFREEFGVNPRDWVLVTALRGSHNNVEGIKKIGIKTALKLVSDPYKYEEVYAANKDLIDRNQTLIEIPYVLYTKTIRIPILKKPSVQEPSLMRALHALGIQYTGKMSDAFGLYSTSTLTTYTL